MASGMQVEVIRRTQETLGNVIKKPPLNEKLLTKPPFRFLHDIITNVITTTGFMKGLYTADELQSENVKDKDAKIAFLQKAIDVVGLVNGNSLSVRPAKIVAGHEPEKTNEFLQALATCILNKKDGSAAVKQVTEGKAVVNNKKEIKVKEPKSKEPIKKTSKTTSKVAEKVDKTKKTTSKTKPEVKKSPKIVPPAKEEEIQMSTQLVEGSPNSASPKKSEVVENVSKEAVELETQSIPLQVPSTPTKEPEIPAPNKAIIKDTQENATADEIKEPKEKPKHERPSTNKVRPITAKQSVSEFSKLLQMTEPKPSETQVSSPEKGFFDGNSRPQSSVSVRSARIIRTARPTTARPAPPRILNKNIVNAEETVRAPSAKQVASLILDDDNNKDEEDEGFVVEDKVEEDDPLTDITTKKFVTGDIIEDEKQGSLVKQMLETKKDLEGGSQQVVDGRFDGDKPHSASSKRELETTGKDLEQLRQFIQTVSRSANPLGKMLDYLQEDIDAMNQELRMWHNEHQQNVLALRREENVTESILDPLGRQLEELDQAVQDQLDRISAIKANILHNDERIQRMLVRVQKP